MSHETSLDLNEAGNGGVLGCSGISWTICKQSAPCSRQITTTVPHHSIFTGRMLFLMPNEQYRITEGINLLKVVHCIVAVQISVTNVGR